MVLNRAPGLPNRNCFIMLNADKMLPFNRYLKNEYLSTTRACAINLCGCKFLQFSKFAILSIIWSEAKAESTLNGKTNFFVKWKNRLEMVAKSFFKLLLILQLLLWDSVILLQCVMQWATTKMHWFTISLIELGENGHAAHRVARKLLRWSSWAAVAVRENEESDNIKSTNRSNTNKFPMLNEIRAVILLKCYRLWIASSFVRERCDDGT